MIEKCIDSLRAMNPGWEYRFYTDDDWHGIINSQSDFNYEDLTKYPSGIQRSDIFRCAALLRHGGLYADVDMLGVRKIDSLIASAMEAGLILPDTEVVLTTDHPIHSRHSYRRGEILMNNFMLAKPGAGFFEIYLDEMKRAVAHAPCPTGNPMDTTGPLAMTRIIREHGGPAALKIAVVPYFWINPIPDMARRFPERPIYQRMIEDGSWRSSICPYFVHCWWHSYLDVETESHYEKLVQTASSPACRASSLSLA